MQKSLCSLIPVHETGKERSSFWESCRKQFGQAFRELASLPDLKAEESTLLTSPDRLEKVICCMEVQAPCVIVYFLSFLCDNRSLVLAENQTFLLWKNPAILLKTAWVRRQKQTSFRLCLRSNLPVMYVLVCGNTDVNNALEWFVL